MSGPIGVSGSGVGGLHQPLHDKHRCTSLQPHATTLSNMPTGLFLIALNMTKTSACSTQLRVPPRHPTKPIKAGRAEESHFDSREAMAPLRSPHSRQAVERKPDVSNPTLDNAPGLIWASGCHFKGTTSLPDLGQNTATRFSAVSIFGQWAFRFLVFLVERLGQSHDD